MNKFVINGNLLYVMPIFLKPGGNGERDRHSRIWVHKIVRYKNVFETLKRE